MLSPLATRIVPGGLVIRTPCDSVERVMCAGRRGVGGGRLRAKSRLYTAHRRKLPPARVAGGKAVHRQPLASYVLPTRCPVLT
eukprot:2979020-Rhodomonas_salina.1